MPHKSVGQLEAQISEAMVKFEREHMGRGPNRTRTHVLDDVIMVRLEGVLTPAELQLLRCEAVERGTADAHRELEGHAEAPD